MNHVLTLISENEIKLANNHIEAVKKYVLPSKINWLSPEKAVDLFFEDEKIYNSFEKLRITLDKAKIDCILQPAENRKKKLLCVDMDSTIIQEECLDELAKFFGIGDKVSAITERAMQGELDFNQSLTKRVLLLKDTDISVIGEVYKTLTLTSGAEKLIKTMNANGAKTILISGGFTVFADKIAERLGCNEAYSNVFEIKNNKLTGKVIEPFINANSKKEILENSGFATIDTMAVGDGANDIPMICSAGIGIAFHANPATENAVKHCIRHADLSALLYMQGYNDAEINSN